MKTKIKNVGIKSLLTLSLFISSFVTFAQSEDKIEERVEIEAQFTGKKTDMLVLLSKNICFAKKLAKTYNEDQTEKIEFKFLVEKDGSVSEILVFNPIFKNTTSLNQKILEVYKTFPGRFYPAEINFVKVRSYARMFITLFPAEHKTCNEKEESVLYDADFKNEMDTKTIVLVNRTTRTLYFHLKYVDPKTKKIVLTKLKLKPGKESSDTYDFEGNKAITPSERVEIKYLQSKRFYYKYYLNNEDQISDEGWGNGTIENLLVIKEENITSK